MGGCLDISLEGISLRHSGGRLLRGFRVTRSSLLRLRRRRCDAHARGAVLIPPWLQIRHAGCNSCGRRCVAANDRWTIRIRSFGRRLDAKPALDLVPLNEVAGRLTARPLAEDQAEFRSRPRERCRQSPKTAPEFGGEVFLRPWRLFEGDARDKERKEMALAHRQSARLHALQFARGRHRQTTSHRRTARRS